MILYKFLYNYITLQNGFNFTMFRLNFNNKLLHNLSFKKTFALTIKYGDLLPIFTMLDKLKYLI